MLKLHLLKVEALKMVKNKRDLKSPNRNRSFGGGRTNRNRDANSAARATGNIKVIIRVRPFNDSETGSNCRNIIKVLSSQIMVFDPKDDDDEAFFYHGVKQCNRDPLKRAHKNIRFTFDHIFDNQSNNSNVFEGSTKALIDRLMSGYNCSVFVYGATGAGKTHTMLGNCNDPGVTFRTMTELYSRREQLEGEREFELAMTYLEVYNETVQDLLNPGKILHLREDGKFGVVVSGNSIHRIQESSKLFELLEQGNCNRTQHPTDANAESSRSHAIFQVYLRMKIKETGEVRVAKLSMIDLAGSERGAATGFSGVRFNEGANINKSLLALGNCINSLADGQKHIPYRDSKLTRLLKDSLGGNCQTVMIANISPSSNSFDDTYNTLKYATRATKIKSNIKQNVVNCETNVKHYIQLVEKLTAENEHLKMQLTKQESVLKTLDVADIESPDYEVKKQLENLYTEKKQLEERIGNLTSTMKLMMARKKIKEECDSRLSGICVNTPDKEFGHRRLGNAVSSLERQIANLQNEIANLNENSTQLSQKIKDYLEKSSSLTLFAKVEDAEIARLKATNLATCSESVVVLQKKELKIRDNLIEQLCKVLQPCYGQLSGLGYATDELVSNYNALVKNVQGIRNITWEDGDDSGVGSATNLTEPEEKCPSPKSERETNSLDYTYVVASKSPVEHLLTKGNSSNEAVGREDTNFKIHADQLTLNAYDNIPSLEVGSWMDDGFGVKKVMTKLFTSPLDEEVPLKEVHANKVHTATASQSKKPATIVSRHLTNKAKGASTNRTPGRSPTTFKENVATFRARPVPKTTNIRPKELIDKPRGIVKTRTQCALISRNKLLLHNKEAHRS